MEQKIRSSGHALVICTPAYARRSNRRIGGVGYEQQIISGRIAAGIPRRKFIPIIRNGEIKPGPRCAIPEHFHGSYMLDMRAKRLRSDKLEELLRAIFNEKRLLKALRRDNGRDLIRLPSLKLDGWHLVSGVKTNRKYPKTFWIPPENKRDKLRPGDLVKLVFYIRERDGSLLGERMWVKVTGTSGPYFFGDLANQPVAEQRNTRRKLRWGSHIVFLSEHVIDIIPLAKPSKRKRATRH